MALPQGARTATRLGELEALVGDLRRRVEALERRVPAPAPAGADVAVIHAIAADVGASWFTSAGVLRHVATGAASTLATALQAALIETARELGALLRYAEGRPIDGLVVERRPKGTRDGALWRVRVCDSATRAGGPA